MLKRALVLSGCLLSVCSLAYAQDAYPTKAIRMIVPFAAGGPSDIAARLVARGLIEQLGQPVIIENKAGAGAVSGTDYVAKSVADGYTLLFGTIAHTIAPAVNPSLPYDPIKDFTAIGLVGRAPLVLVVRPALGVKSVTELTRLMQESPGKYSYGSAGNGAVDHLAAGWFEARAQVKGLHVPYRGSSLGLLDLAAGRLDFMITTFFVALPYIRSGALTALAATSAERLSLLPNVPTMAQAGLSDFEVSTWYAMLAPAGVPKAIIQRLNQAMVKTLAEPELKTRFLELGAEVASDTSPEQLSQFIKSELARWDKVIKASGVVSQ